jgi:hypothetical protein
MSCIYHKVIHTDLDYQNAHQHCVNHGHCLNPTQCPMFKSCPAHVCGKNMFLAWTSSTCDGYDSSSCSGCDSSSCSGCEDDLLKAVNQMSRKP